MLRFDSFQLFAEHSPTDSLDWNLRYQSQQAPKGITSWIPKTKRQEHPRGLISIISTSQSYSKNGTVVPQPVSAPKYIPAPSNGTITTPANATLSTYNPHFNRLVMSDSENHAARRLCESKTSVGPDFVNVVEGIFCCMTSKKTHPICGPGVEDNCFNLEVKSLVLVGRLLGIRLILGLLIGLLLLSRYC